MTQIQQMEELYKAVTQMTVLLPPERVAYWLGHQQELRELLAGKPQATPASVPNPILELVTTITIPATSGEFIAKNEFIVDRSPEAKVKISGFGGDFKAWFLGKTEEPRPETTLRVHKLRKASLDGPIITELGGEVRAETTLQEVFFLMEKQGHGEAGTLLVNGWANIFYVRDKDGALRAVHVGWDGVGWDVGACSVLRPGDWGGGRRVFSRSPR